MKLIRS